MDNSSKDAIEEIEQLIKLGRYFEAHNLAENSCVEYPDELRIQQLCGLSMSKSGAHLQAIDYLAPVYDKDPQNPETAGILGGVYKDQFRSTADSSFALKSRETYFNNYSKTQDTYTGINAATMSLITGKGHFGKEIAKQVVENIPADSADFWALATLGEANLLLGDFASSRVHYAKAAKLGSNQFGLLSSVRGQLLVLEHYINVPDQILDIFRPPAVAAFAGHMIDKSDREFPRFPESITNNIKFAIGNELRIHNIRIGYTSLACGSDILFAQALLELDGELNIILPFDKEDFIETSVAFAGKQWVDWFNEIVNSHNVSFITRQNYDHNDYYFDFLGKVVIGQSILRAALFQATPHLITVSSDADSSKLTGGTHSIQDQWPFKNQHINVNPDLYIPANIPITTGTQENKKEVSSNSAQVKFYVSIVFAGGGDADELSQALSYLKNELMEFPGTRRSKIEGNTIMALYSKASHAIGLGLRLLGTLSKELSSSCRISLDAIPVVPGTLEENFTRVATITNMLLPGVVYGTMRFSASLAAELPSNYEFRHVGVLGEVSDQEIYMIGKKEKTAMN